MKLSFSTLACPDWTMPQIIATAAAHGYDGIELRFVEGEDSLWKLPALSGTTLASTRQTLSDHSLAIPCVDTSCRFHSPDTGERKRWLIEAERMSDLAAELGAPAIRVFGDTIQPGADRAMTRDWIADHVQALAEKIAPKGVEVWIENHGDFAAASETADLLLPAHSSRAGVVWDPANSFVANQERPAEGAAILGRFIRHVHIKDLRREGDKWKQVLTGEGDLPLLELKHVLEQMQYDRFLSFEWEKKWHPEIADAEVALPQFVDWFRKIGSKTKDPL
jgi:sugar phosphate isomerase/epimerase